MKRLSKLAQSPVADCRLLVRAMILLPVFRLALWLLPFWRLVIIMAGSRPRLFQASACQSERIAWAIQLVSRYVPHATCLAQALTAKLLLEDAGIQANLHIGVAKTASGRFEAHAWVETQGRVITGGGELNRYSRLLRWES